MKSMPIHETVTVTSSAQVGIGAKVLKKVVIGAHTGNAKAVFYNSADNSGTVLLTISALANKPNGVDLCEVGGLMFATAMYCEVSGTAVAAYLWFE